MMDRYREDVDTEDSVEEGDMPTFLKDDDDLDQSTAVLNEKTKKIQKDSYAALQSWEGKRSQKITEAEEEETVVTKQNDDEEEGKEPEKKMP